MRVSVTGRAAIGRRDSLRVHYTMTRESGDKRLRRDELMVGKASKPGGAGRGFRCGEAVANQFIGAMNQFYKYDKHGVGAYNLAHPEPQLVHSVV